MAKRRKTYRNRKIDYVLYVFTIVLCVFTVIVLLSGRERDGADGNGTVENAGENGADAGQMADVQTETGTVAPQQDVAAGQSLNPGAGVESTAGGSAINGTGEEIGTGTSEANGAGDGNRAGTSEANGADEESRAGTGEANGAGEESRAGTSVTNGAGEENRAGEIKRSGASGEKPEITLVMAGDILLHTPVAESGKREDGNYDFSAVFAEMKEEISSADLALVNQEVILGGEELGVSGYPAFNAPYELGDALADAGFDVVLHATNHALDKGKRGIVNCLAFWQEEYPDIAVLGIHGSEADQEEIYVYEQDGIRLAVLNYTYGTNGIALPQDMPWAVDLLDKTKVAEDLQRAQELADFVIVCPHWGTEYFLEETAEQEAWAAFFAENGADLILGTHPHVIEPVEWVGAAEGSEDGRGTLTYYSLGNFVNWTSGTGDGVANRMVGGMARVTIGLDEAGEAVITSYGVEPLVCHVEQGYGGVTVYPLEEYTEELAGRNEIVGQDGQFSLSYCRKLAEEVFGSLWLP